MKKHIQHKWVTWLTGTWNTSTVSSSRRTLHGTVLPFLRGEDTAGADAELIMSDECCKLTWVWFTVVKSVPATIYATLSMHPNFSRKLVHGTQIFCEKSAKLITHSHSRINILSSLFFTVSRYASVVDAADCSHFVCPFVSHTYAWCWND